MMDTEQGDFLRQLKINGNKLRRKDRKIALFTEYSAYSTVFDALFLLVLVSLAGVLLLPSMQAEKQYSAAGYATASELDTYMLESLLSCKLEDFEYESSPLTAINISAPENSVVENPSHTLFAKEQKHRTFADLVVEYLALSPKIQYEFTPYGPCLSLNTLTKDYCLQDSEAITAYLDRRIAGRFSYRFEAYWQPVNAYPMRSELIIGEEPPVNAFRQSTKLSMPLYATAPSKDALLACVNDSLLAASLNSTNSTGEKTLRSLNDAFLSCFDVAAQQGAEEVLELIFLSDYSGMVLGDETDESLKTLLYGVSENPENFTSAEEEFAAYHLGMLETGFQLYPKNYSKNPSTGPSLIRPVLEKSIRDYIKAQLLLDYSPEIVKTSTSIMKADHLSEAQALRDSLVESIYRQINPGGAQIVLSLWDSS
jgi:hypothetical protein